jgi:hypothetical protein
LPHSNLPHIRLILSTYVPRPIFDFFGAVNTRYHHILHIHMYLDSTYIFAYNVFATHFIGAVNMYFSTCSRNSVKVFPRTEFESPFFSPCDKKMLSAISINSSGRFFLLNTNGKFNQSSIGRFRYKKRD